MFSAAAIFLAVIPAFVIARTNAAFRAFKRTAVLLSCSTVVRKLAVFMHCKTCFTNDITGRQLFRIFGISL